MLALALFSWWYTTAWKDLAVRTQRRVGRTLGFFSVGLLLRTLFDPFRQIAAGQVRGSIDAQFRAWVDRTFSRFIGAAVRTIFIILGIVSAVVLMFVGFVQVLLWPLVPLLPAVAIIGFVQGWTL